MKKIMFNDKFGLTEAVLNGTKTMTRRVIPHEHRIEKYKIGEEIAIAQSYHALNKSGYIAPAWCEFSCEDSPGYDNKMFVRADLMPHRIRIINLWFEHLQDISEDECLKEGVIEDYFKNFPKKMFFPYKGCKDTEVTCTAREAFHVLINKVSGKGTWEKNPYVIVYKFELLR